MDNIYDRLSKKDLIPLGAPRAENSRLEPPRVLMKDLLKFGLLPARNYIHRFHSLNVEEQILRQHPPVYLSNLA